MDEHTLFSHIRQKSEAYCARLIDEAKREAADIIGQAEQEAARMEEKAKAEINNEADRLLERKYNAIRHGANAERYRLQAEALEDLWAEAEREIECLRSSASYPRILAALFRECTTSAPEGSVVKSSSDDAETVQDLIAHAGRDLTFEPDDGIGDGVVVIWPGGKVVIKNTLSHRLARLKSSGNETIAALLFGNEGELPS